MSVNDKNEILLKVLNNVLKSMGKPEIDKLEDFKDIDREWIATAKNDQMLLDMENELFGPFDKAKMRFYKRKEPKNYIMTFLRRAATECGFQYNYYKKDITELKDDKKFHRTHNFYSLKKNNL